MLKIIKGILGVIGLFKARNWLRSPRGRGFLRGTKAFLYVVLYLTFLAPAYVLAYYWVAAVFGAPEAKAPDPWDGRFLLLPVCLLAPYVLVRAFTGSRWLAMLAALALALGLMPILGPPLSMELCREPLLGWWHWLADFCAASMVGWSSGISAASAVLHLLVLALGAKLVMKAPEEEKRKAPEEEGAGGQASAGAGQSWQGFLRRVGSNLASKASALGQRVAAGVKKVKVVGAARAGGHRVAAAATAVKDRVVSRVRNANVAGAVRKGGRKVREFATALRRLVVGRRAKNASPDRPEMSADNVDPGVKDGIGGMQAGAGALWRRSVAWTRKTARRGVAKASEGAGALRREAGPRAAAVAQAAKRGVLAGWRGVKGAAGKLKTAKFFKTAPGWRGLKDATKKRDNGVDESGAGP